MLSTQLSKLKEALTQAHSLQDAKVAIEALAPELGITYDEHDAFSRHHYRYATIAFATPVSADTFCEAMGWQLPYALAGDVHQTRWRIQLWVADLADPFGPRIHTRFPTLGAWALIPQLTGRPQGALPSLQAGASPAYDMREYAADIVSIEVYAAADLER